MIKSNHNQHDHPFFLVHWQLLFSQTKSNVNSLKVKRPTKANNDQHNHTFLLSFLREQLHAKLAKCLFSAVFIIIEYPN